MISRLADEQLPIARPAQQEKGKRVKPEWHLDKAQYIRAFLRKRRKSAKCVLEATPRIPCKTTIQRSLLLDPLGKGGQKLEILVMCVSVYHPVIYTLSKCHSGQTTV